jgi:hypothetical protein
MIEVIFRYTCGACGVVREERFKFYRGSEMPRPCAPQCWGSINGYIFCQDHIPVVRLKTKGKKDTVIKI